MSNPYTIAIATQFQKAVVHTTFLIDQFGRNLDAIQKGGYNGLIALRDGPFSPLSIATQFEERAEGILAIERDEVSTIAITDLAIVQNMVADTVIPQLQLAGHDWSQLLPKDKNIVETVVDMAMNPQATMDSMVVIDMSLAEVRDHLVMYGLPQTSFLLEALKAGPR